MTHADAKRVGRKRSCWLVLDPNGWVESAHVHQPLAHARMLDKNRQRPPDSNPLTTVRADYVWKDRT